MPLTIVAVLAGSLAFAADKPKASAAKTTNSHPSSVVATSKSTQTTETPMTSKVVQAADGKKKWEEFLVADAAGNLDLAVKLMEEAAADGVMEAQFAFGCRLVEKGRGDEVRRGIAFWEAAAAQGDSLLPTISALLTNGERRCRKTRKNPTAT